MITLPPFPTKLVSSFNCPTMVLFLSLFQLCHGKCFSVSYECEWVHDHPVSSHHKTFVGPSMVKNSPLFRREWQPIKLAFSLTFCFTPCTQLSPLPYLSLFLQPTTNNARTTRTRTSIRIPSITPVLLLTTRNNKPSSLLPQNSPTHRSTDSTPNIHRPCQPTQRRKPSKEVNLPTLNNPPTHNRPTLNHRNNNPLHNHHQQSVGHRTQAPSRVHPLSSWTQPFPDPTTSCPSTRPSSSNARLLLPCHLVRRVDIMN